MKKESMVTREMLGKLVDAIQMENSMLHRRLTSLENELRRFKRPFDQAVDAEIRRRLESKDDGEGKDCASTINPIYQALAEMERSEFEQANPVGERVTETTSQAGLAGRRRKG